MITLNIITLSELKQHCRVDYTDEDDILSVYGAAAEENVLKMTRRTQAELTTLNGGTFPVSLKVAILVLAATSFRMREADAASSMNAVPYLVEQYVKPWVKLSDRTTT